MTEISIDESALESMESLLGEQFPDTLEFCCAEFERLGNETLLFSAEIAENESLGSFTP